MGTLLAMFSETSEADEEDEGTANVEGCEEED